MSYEVLLLPLNRPTINGRIYTPEAIAGALENLKERVATGQVIGEFGSPRERVACDVISRTYRSEETVSACPRTRSA